MKRIYYGNITLDVADSVAALLEQVVKEISDRQHYRTKALGGGSFGSEAYAIGRQQFEILSGYLNGSETESDVSLWIGGAVPIAIAPAFPAKSDPTGTASTTARLNEYLTE